MLERYSPDWYGRMVPDPQGDWLLFPSVQVAMMDALEANGKAQQATIADLQGQLALANERAKVWETQARNMQAVNAERCTEIDALQQRVAQLEGEPYCVVCGRKEPCALKDDPMSPCTFEPTPAQLMRAHRVFQADHARVLRVIETIRDAVLNGRGPLAEMEVDNDVINAVLAIIDDNSLPAQPAQGGA